MSYRNFLDELKKGMPSNGYLLVSSDPFLHTEAVSVIKKLVPAAEADFNFQVFDLLEAKDSGIPFEQVLDVLNTVPFFSGRKFVLIENLQKLLKKDLKKLEYYLENPAESSVLVALHAGAVKKESRDSLSGLKQIVLDISEREIPIWLRAKAKSRGFGLSEEAADYMLGTMGPDLGMLSSEIDKCALIGKAEIEKKDIMEIMEGKRTYSAFALVDALRARDAERAFRVYRILRETEEPYSLLGALNWEYGKSLADRSSKDKAYGIFDVLNKADIGIKTSGGAYPVELLLIKLLRLSKQR
jgi:DNA polymerase III delta subunit